ncbi:MAG TPA: uroporphyrinogen decarboxylase family protein [Negativicutes bacterium]|nr:uroporphyrinogen decarboxylase family protein [Negativicutes bacterium]
MKPINRIESLLAGKKLDTPAINLWKHFPPYDEDPKELVKKTIQFQERFNWDFVKVTYQGLYSIQDWGSKIKWPERDCQWPNTCSKVGAVTDCSVKKVADWESLKVLPINQGAMADAVLAAKEIVKRFKGEAPVVVTVFNPLTTAIKMSGDRLFLDMRRNPDSFKKGLEVITETTVNYVKELVNVGADGIFFASQLGTYDRMSLKEYEEFGRPYDLQILDTVKDKMWFNIMHMHGNAPMFELMEKYPVQAVNWHDRLVDIKLKDGRRMSNKILIGGVDEFGVLKDANEEELKAHLKDAVDQVEDGRLILGPGCCVPLNVSEDRFEVAKRLLESIR